MMLTCLNCDIKHKYVCPGCVIIHRLNGNSMITKIVLHHSASPQNRNTNAEEIHGWHLARGWDGIGYHYVILENGAIEHGRPEYWMGSHAKGHNKDSIGICLIGDFTKENMTDLQNAALRNLLYSLKDRHSNATIHGHGDLPDQSTQCPGFDVDNYLFSIGLSNE